MKVFAKFDLHAQKDFFKTLKERVNGYFSDNNISPYGNFYLYFKTLILMGMYVAPLVIIYCQILPVWANWLLYMVAGLGVAGVGMGFMHDAMHGSYSSNRYINRTLGFSMELLGGSSFNWKMQHNVLHHTYTNVVNMDRDVTDKPYLRFEPTAKWRPMNQYQQIYAFFFYMLMTLSWIFHGDAVQLLEYNKWGMTEKFGHNPKKEVAQLIFSKLLYVFLIIALPIFILGLPWWEVLVGFLFMNMVAGFVMAVVFQLAHVVEPTDYPLPNAEGNIENSWAVHQLYTTANVRGTSKLLSWYIGGLNYQIEHHLFPNISHVHYPKITGIVEQTAKEYGLPYHKFSSPWVALRSHYNQLKELGKKPEPKPTQPQPKPELVTSE